MSTRVARLEDLEAVSSLNQDLFKHDSVFDKQLVLNWPQTKEGQEYFTHHIIDADKVCVVVEDAGVIVGYLTGSLTVDATRNGLVASLNNMLVKPSFHKQGFGTSLFAAFKKWATTKNVDRISVSAYSENVEALNFYKSVGFQPLAETFEIEL